MGQAEHTCITNHAGYDTAKALSSCCDLPFTANVTELWARRSKIIEIIGRQNAAIDAAEDAGADIDAIRSLEIIGNNIAWELLEIDRRILARPAKTGAEHAMHALVLEMNNINCTLPDGLLEIYCTTLRRMAMA